MRIAIILCAAVALAGCGTPLVTPNCAPTTIQPAHDQVVTPRGRVAGCSDLVAVSVAGYDGITLYVHRANLANVADGEINALPAVERGL